MPNTWKPLSQLADELVNKLDLPSWNTHRRQTVVEYDHKTGKYRWRPAPCPQDEGQFEAAARQRDAREGFGDE